MRYGGLLGCSTIAMLLAAGAAHAQATRQFDLELEARGVYDTNVARSNAAVAALRGVEREDWIFSPSVRANIVQPFGRQAVFLNGAVGYEFYNKNDQLNRERIGLQGGLQTGFGPCRGSLVGGYDRKQSDLRDLTLLTVENMETITSAGVDAVCGRQAGLGVMASATQKWADNSASSRVTADYTDFMAVAGVVYQRPTFGELNLFGSYGKIKYDNRLVPAGAGFVRDGYERHGAGVRYTRRLGARLQGSVSASYISVEPESPAVDDFQGANYSADITFRSSDRLQMALAFAREVTPSNRIETAYSVEDSYRLEGTYAMGSRIKLGLGASYSKADYEGAALTPTFSVTEEEIRRVFGSVGVDIGRRFAVKLDATQEERDANVPGFDYTANRVGLSLVAKL
ncbi:MAG: outer membrane beta-barrel protein [Phenylobacterium sp.]|uniref:outer membrane beta-barrel protein n=1 Tax=Phenylobacterium sp. TaxID=1871053 RepID=UPI0039191C84